MLYSSIEERHRIHAQAADNHPDPIDQLEKDDVDCVPASSSIWRMAPSMSMRMVHMLWADVLGAAGELDGATPKVSASVM